MLDPGIWIKRILLAGTLVMGLQQQTYAQIGSAYTIKQFGTDNGLPSNGIRGLHWDEGSGFLWIATEAGIVRYNGIELKVFSKQTTSFIGAERIQYLLRSFTDSLFAADENGSIYLISRNAPTPMSVADHLQSAPGFCLLASRKLFNTPLPNAKFGNISMIEDRFFAAADSSFFVVNDGVLYYWSASMTVPEKIDIPEKDIHAYFRSGSGFFVAATDGSMFMLNADKRIWRNVKVRNPTGEEVNLPKGSVIFSRSGMVHPFVLIGKDMFLMKFDGSAFQLTKVASDLPLNFKVRFVDYSPRLRQLFIGTDSKGVYVVSANMVQSVKLPDTVLNQKSSYYAQVELNNGQVLTSEGHLLGQAGKEEVVLPVHDRFENSTYIASDGSFYFLRRPADHEGNLLYVYRPGAKRLDSFPRISGYERLAFYEGDGVLYAGSAVGLSILEGDSLRYLLRFPGATQRQPGPYDLHEATSGEFLMATCNALLRIQPGKSAIDTLMRNGDVCFRTIRKFGDLLFIGSYGGGYYGYRKGVLKQMPIDKARYMQYSHCFIPDGEGFCWISTNRGLFRARIDDMKYAFEHDGSQVFYQYFGKSDGMLTAEMNGGCTPCALMLANGKLSFPTMDGLLWVDPKQVNNAYQASPIYIDAIRADDADVKPVEDSTYFLPAGTKNAQVHLGLSLWTNPENVYVEYQLDNEEWLPVRTGLGTVVSLEKLSPGPHVLKLRKIDGFGIGNFAYKTIKLHVVTPWFRQNWIYAIMASLLAALFVLVYQIRVRRLLRNAEKLEQVIYDKTKELMEKNEALEQMDKVKTRLISIISHDIITPLRFMHLAGNKYLEKKKDASDDKDLEVIREMADTSFELQLLSSNILNWIKFQNENRKLQKEYINVHDQVNQVLGVLNSSVLKERILLQNMVDPDLVIFQYYEPLRIILYNLITNAINFSDHGLVEVGSELKQEMVLIFVKDQGLGMSTEQIANLLGTNQVITSTNVDNRKGNGLGYSIIRDLSKMIEAELNIESRKGEGTIVKLMIRKGT